MRILFTICGRAGSVGIKNKNIRDFAGYPLPYYSLSTIDLYLKKNPETEADIVINTDSPELIDLMERNPFFPMDVIVREERLAGGTVGKIDVIADCLSKMEERKGYSYDFVVDLDITSPLRTVDDLSNLITKHIETGADLTTSVTSCRRNPYFNQLMRTEHGFKKVIDSNFTARQQAPEIFDMNASLYAYAPSHLRSGKHIMDGYVECIEMYDTGILDLDHENDFALMEVLAKYLFENHEGFREIYENVRAGMSKTADE